MSVHIRYVTNTSDEKDPTMAMVVDIVVGYESLLAAILHNQPSVVKTPNIINNTLSDSDVRMSPAITDVVSYGGTLQDAPI